MAFDVTRPTLFREPNPAVEASVPTTSTFHKVPDSHKPGQASTGASAETGTGPFCGTHWPLDACATITMLMSDTYSPRC